MYVLIMRGYNCNTSQFHLWPPQPRHLDIVYNGELELPKASFEHDGSTLVLEKQATPAGVDALWISSSAGVPLLKPLDYRRRIDYYELTLGGSVPSWHVRLSERPIHERSVLYSFGFKTDEEGELFDFRYQSTLIQWREQVNALSEEDQADIRMYHAYEMTLTDTAVTPSSYALSTEE